MTFSRISVKESKHKDNYFWNEGFMGLVRDKQSMTYELLSFPIGLWKEINHLLYLAYYECLCTGTRFKTPLAHRWERLSATSVRMDILASFTPHRGFFYDHSVSHNQDSIDMHSPFYWVTSLKNHSKCNLNISSAISLLNLIPLTFPDPFRLDLLPTDSHKSMNLYL